MKRVVVAAAILSMAAGIAYAQMSTGKHPTPLDLQYERERREQQENERAYNEQMKRMRSQSPSSTKIDPWAGVRPATEGSPKR